ncbi:MAG: DUF3656 domain-containing protein [Planctomycetota bacterium]
MPIARKSPIRAPELLSPAGDWDCARAAVENGADAIYFGLDCGFNARYRAKNFTLDDLPELTEFLHRRGVRGYATMNTLAFPSELPKLAGVVEQLATSGVDAILVQDFGVARIAREICRDLEIHASTQMSLTSAETIAVASELGLNRVVLARELSTSEVQQIADATDMPLEVFIHGALCVAYSGQCLTSESLGGRSANRGQCAQACRLPYELVCDGKDEDLGAVQYLLSPQDLAGYAAIPNLVQAGVASLKIEGRLKTPEYVANITRHYRRAINQAIADGRVTVSDHEQREMELSFSRGFTPGWLEGNDHKRLVPGLHSAKRGILLGTIESQQGDRIRLQPKAPVALGDGLAISGDQNFETQGGRVYEILDDSQTRIKEAPIGDPIWIGFGRGEIDWSCVAHDATVFKNDDPKLNRKLRQTFAGDKPRHRRELSLDLTATTGKPMKLTGRLSTGATETVHSEEALQAARNRPPEEDQIRDKLSRLGGSGFQLSEVSLRIEGQPMVPASVLNQLRRALLDKLCTGEHQRLVNRKVDTASGNRLLRPIEASHEDLAVSDGTELVVLCRTLEQLEALTETEVKTAYCDFHDIRQYGDAVEMAHRAGLRIALASIRMQKPGEIGLLRSLIKRKPDFILARNLAALRYALENQIEAITDFSLNVTNHRSAQWLKMQGATRITCSYDLNRDQLMDLLGSVPSRWMEVVIHQHMPMFHMEHCVFCAVLSPGTNKTNCGRPCDRHVVQLRDRVGQEHTLQADIACRNTLYNASPQSGAEVVQELIQKGVSAVRMELLEQNKHETKRTVEIYRSLLSGKCTGTDVWRQLNAINRVGVTRGTLEAKRDPLKII